MESNHWYYVSNGQQQGPVPWETVVEWVAAGRLRASDLMWTEGMPQWREAGRIPQLRELFTAQAVGAGVPVPPLGYQHAAVLPYGQGVAYAGFWLRVVAAIIDALVLAAGQCVLSAPLAIPGVGRHDLWGFSGVELFGNLASIAISWAYSALMESSRCQATLGKMAVGILVTDMEGNRISFARATGRHFAKYISALLLGVGYLMAAFTPQKQGLHDMLASTLVVRKDQTTI